MVSELNLQLRAATKIQAIKMNAQANKCVPREISTLTCTTNLQKLKKKIKNYKIISLFLSTIPQIANDKFVETGSKSRFRNLLNPECQNLFTK